MTTTSTNPLPDTQPGRGWVTPVHIIPIRINHDNMRLLIETAAGKYIESYIVDRAQVMDLAHQLIQALEHTDS